MISLASNNSLDIFSYLANKLKDNTSVRDLVAQESDIKMFYMTYFSLNRLYASISELELNQGYADILLLKAPNIEYDIPNILIEFKFFKQSDKNIDINDAVQKAQNQIDNYKQTTKFDIDKSIVVIFQGFELVYCEFYNRKEKPL
jgi:hypothetical protein